MADYNLKTAAEDTSLDTNAFLFGADSQSASSPSVYKVSTLKTLLLGGGSLAVASGKTLTASNSLTLAGTDGTTMTFPSASGTVATLNAANLFTKANTFQPDSDAQAGTFRRNSSGQTANVLEIQTEANAFLAAFDKTGALTIGAASGNTGALKLKGTTSGTVTLSTADAAGTWTMKLPTSAGTNNYVLATDGSGNTSWVAQSGGGTPGGSDTQIQYNNAGSFGGLSQLTYSGGKINVVSAPFGLSGNISSAAWTTNGIRYANSAATLTDTSSSGTVAAAYTDIFGGNTIAASNSTTFTDYYTMFVSGPTAGTNVTMTNRWALGLSGNLRVAGGTVTANAPALDISQTWNAAQTFSGIKLNITDTSSNTASLLLDIGTGGGTYASKFSVRKDGFLQTQAGANFIGAAGAANSVEIAAQAVSSRWFQFKSSGGSYLSFLESTADGNIRLNDVSSSKILTISWPASATLQLGAADAAAPVAQTLQVQNVVAGTSNTAGTNFTIAGSRGTGTGAGGSIIFQVAPAGTTGTTQNALATALTIGSDRSVTVAGQLSNYQAGTGTGFTVSASGGIEFYVSYGRPFYVDTSGNVRIASAAAYQFSTDLYLYRDAANTLALKNSTNAQIFRAYSTTASSGSYGYLAAGVTDAGVATADTLFIGTGGTGAALTKLVLAVNGSAALSFSGTAATFASSLTVSGVAVVNGGIKVGAAQDFYWDLRSTIRSSTNGNLTFLNYAATDFGLLQFGGTTSSFPALKRSSTTLQVRLADDSAFAPLSCGNTTASGTALDVSGTGAASLFSVTNTTTGTLFSVVNSSAANLLTVSDTVTTGTQVVGTAFGLTGNISAAAWTTSGIRYRNVAATLTDTSSSGTVATAYTDVFGGNTIAASNSTTFTNYATFRITGPAAGTNVTLTNTWALSLGGGLIIDDAYNLAVGTTTGTKIGTATSQKIGFWNATPIVQPTTAVAAATVAATGTGDVVAASTTFDGYTIPQIVKALRNAGLLA